MATAISAFTCSENRGSEHELGWKCLKECAARSLEVHLFTSVKINPDIEAQVRKYSLDNVVVHLVDLPKGVDSFFKSISGAGYQLAAYVWEFRLFLHMFRRYRRNHFNVGIKSTYGSYRWPSFLWYFSKELHIDPLSGGGRCPFRFQRFFSPKARRKELFRMFIQRATLCDPFVLLTLFKAKKLYAGNTATRSILPEFARRKCVVKQDFLTIEAADFKIEEAREAVSVDPRILKIFYTGKLHEWKGIKVILEALALLPDDVKYEFTIMGNGPARQFYEDYIHQAKLNVVFIDPKQVPRSDLSFYFLSHDIFAFPTLHGEAGYAPVEAKLHGMKLLTLDFSGLIPNLTEGDICIQTEGKSADDVVQAIANSIEAQYRQLKEQVPADLQ
jgi:glycosyltransferase involved in cell wall biosynthesis